MTHRRSRVTRRKKLLFRVTERHVMDIRSVAAKGGTTAAILVSVSSSGGYPPVLKEIEKYKWSR
ncbi:hypothetical protein J6590_091190 [Homalodisca vitripennis]|nr:hypothetical protein J6590_091190 [Homalodisca vitripennis]